MISLRFNGRISSCEKLAAREARSEQTIPSPIHSSQINKSLIATFPNLHCQMTDSHLLRPRLRGQTWMATSLDAVVRLLSLRLHFLVFKHLGQVHS